MPDHRAPDRCLLPMPGAPSIRCQEHPGHAGNHKCAVEWTYTLDEDDAPTLRIPPVRDSLGPRRRPPAPVVAELSERVDLLRALVDELTAYDDEDQADEDATCGAVVQDVGGRAWICNEPRGHLGAHAHQLAPKR